MKNEGGRTFIEFLKRKKKKKDKKERDQINDL